MFKIFEKLACGTLLLISGLVWAENFDDWLVHINDTKTFVIAGVSNSAENMLVYECNVEKAVCMFKLEASATCEVDEQYPILINSDKGAVNITGICSKTKSGLHILLLKPVEKINSAVIENMNIGFAIPMESGQFKVVRFSLKGSSAAIAETERMAKLLNDSKML